jgi:hypothetical protein
MFAYVMHSLDLKIVLQQVIQTWSSLLLFSKLNYIVDRSSKWGRLRSNIWGSELQLMAENVVNRV